MEVEKIQAQACKFPRMANGTTGRSPDSAAEVVHKMGLSELHYPKDEDDSQQKRLSRTAGAGAVVGIDESNRLRGWHHHSRIVRVSRASGGKDRHSKVLTSKGLRDRRVRLSVPTAIQFYDIQDRLGYDQPSKAVEWLIKVAADSISELPSLNGYFGGSPSGQQLSDGKRTSEENATDQNGFDSADVEMDGDNNPSSQYGQQNQNLSLSKSACSSTSETSKGSGGLSLSQSELRNNRVRARERARERTAKEKKESVGNQQQPLNLISQSSSFTELLTGGIGMSNGVNTTTTSSSPSGSGHQNPSNSVRPWSSAPMDYFTSGLLSTPLARISSGFVGQLQMANNQIPQALPIPPFTISNGSDGSSHHELPPPHNFPFVPEGYIPTVAPTSSTGIEYNLFTISSSSASPAAGLGLGGFNRGTLQSNSSSQLSLLSNLQRFSTVDGPSSPHHQNMNEPFFIGTAVPLDSHHHHHHHHGQFPAAFDGRLHLHYGHNEKEKPTN